MLCMASLWSGGDLLSHVLRRSTIGAAGLNGRVRDGIGCFPRAIATRPWKRSRRERFQGRVIRAQWFCDRWFWLAKTIDSLRPEGFHECLSKSFATRSGRRVNSRMPCAAAHSGNVREHRCRVSSSFCTVLVGRSFRTDRCRDRAVADQFEMGDDVVRFSVLCTQKLLPCLHQLGSSQSED